MRPCTWLALVVLGLCLLGSLEYWDCHIRLQRGQHELRTRRTFQKAVGLPNLAITTAARYLRHYSISVLATPFQDYPASMDHFPAGFAFAVPDYSGTPSSIVIGPQGLIGKIGR